MQVPFKASDAEVSSETSNHLLAAGCLIDELVCFTRDYLSTRGSWHYGSANVEAPRRCYFFTRVLERDEAIVGWTGGRQRVTALPIGFAGCRVDCGQHYDRLDPGLVCSIGCTARGNRRACRSSCGWRSRDITQCGSRRWSMDKGAYPVPDTVMMSVFLEAMGSRCQPLQELEDD